MGDDATVRDQLRRLLDGSQAHIQPRTLLEGFPVDRINRTVPGVPYTAWQLLEHLRLAQRDILDYISPGDYQEPAFPAGYWPDPERQATEEEWASSLGRFLADLGALQETAVAPDTDLTAPLPRNPDHTVLRELLIIGNHNSYHLGQLAILSRMRD